MTRRRNRAKSPSRQSAREEMRNIVSRAMLDTRLIQQQVANALGVERSTVRRQYTQGSGEPAVPIDLSDLLILGRCPDTTEFARRLLLELLAELDAHHLRAVDLERMADSPLPEQRERVIRVLRPLAIKLGLTPSFTISTAEVTPA